MDAETDVVVIGAGAVGLACAAAIARTRRVVVIERHPGPGRETSSRNSGVIHAGLYYAPGSLKARTCVEGRERLYAWCREHDVPHDRSGKILVATDEAGRARMDGIAARARDNGAGDIQILDAAELRRREPLLRGVGALVSPESGVVDAEAYVLSLRRIALSRGADAAWVTSVEGLARTGDRWTVEACHADGERTSISAAVVVNAAGLGADRIAALAGLDIDALGLRLLFCKGEYFSISPRAPRPAARLVYPIPGKNDAGLGIHLTVDLGGRVLAGPDATYVDRIEYGVDESKAEAFAQSVAEYLPGITAEHLSPDYAGIRPKLQTPGGDPRDFLIEEASHLGAPGLVNLIGIESPGLTASLAIGEHVATLL